MTLADVLLTEPLGEDIAHVLGREGNGEGVVGFVLGHGGDMNILGVREVGPGRAVVISKKLGNLADTV